MPEDMVDLKRSPSRNSEVCCLTEDNFPWGTRIHLDDGLVEELGVEALSPGDIVEIRGFAVVKDKVERQDEGDSEKSMSLQMTFMKVKREDSDIAKTLYG